MTAKITLPADAESVPVSEIPYLFARARHPDVDKAGVSLAVIMGKSAPDEQGISDLDDNDKALLSRIWSGIGGYPDSTPVDTFIRDHLTAFESHPERPSWDLRWNSADKNHVARIEWAITFNEYQADIDASIKNDNLDVRNQSTLGPVRLSGFEEAVRRGCVVTIEGLRQIAARYEIGVERSDAAKLPEEASAAPEPEVSCSGCDQGETEPTPLVPEDVRQTEADVSTAGLVAWQAEMIESWPKIMEAYKSKPTARNAMQWLKAYGPRDTIPEHQPDRGVLYWIDRDGNPQTVMYSSVTKRISEWRKAGKIPA